MASQRGTTTPARVTRSRGNTPAPLPALQMRQSHAYGAAGKASLAGQMTQSAAALDQAFDGDTPGPERPRRGRPRKTPVVQASPEPETTMGGSRPITSLHNGEPGYGGTNMPPPPPPPPPAGPNSPAPSPRRPHPPALSNYEPSYLRICWHTLVKWLPSGGLLGFFLVASMISLGLIFFFGTIAAWSPLPPNISPHRDQFFRGLRMAIGMPDVPPGEVEMMWLQARHDKVFHELLPKEPLHPQQWLINYNFLSRIERQEEKSKTVSEVLKKQNVTMTDLLTEFQRIIPSGLMLVEEDGELVIPNFFWQALVQKLQSKDAAPLWDHFLTSNEDKFNLKTRPLVHSGDYRQPMESHKFVTREQLEEAILENSRLMEENHSEQLREYEAEVMREAKNVAAQVLQQSPAAQIIKTQLSALAYTNLMVNTNSRMQQTNYFSPGLGAIIDDRYTSRTFKALSLVQLWGRWLKWATGLSSLMRQTQTPHPPAAALLPWEEATQCWCAAPSNDERALAQLTVRLNHKIRPTNIMIEHIPPGGTLDIEAAPKKFEVWARLESEKEAGRIRGLLDQAVPDWVDTTCGDPPKGEKNWVCMHVGDYDIHHHNYVQTYTFRTAMEGEEFNLSTNQVAIRVVENRGADHTCLYRVRLTGDEMGGKAE